MKRCLGLGLSILMVVVFPGCGGESEFDERHAKLSRAELPQLALISPTELSLDLHFSGTCGGGGFQPLVHESESRLQVSVKYFVIHPGPECESTYRLLDTISLRQPRDSLQVWVVESVTREGPSLDTTLYLPPRPSLGRDR